MEATSQAAEPVMVEWALAYATRGWAVFPCHTVRDGTCSCRLGTACSRPGKHPRISNGRTGATKDPVLIRSWWATWPTANVAIATGAESGLLVLDLDDPTAVDAANLPSSIEAITGRGGRHVLWQYPDDGFLYLTGTNLTAHGVDSRADGGYIIAPPSMHASGRRYCWDVGCSPDDMPLMPAPRWWLDAIRRDPAKQGPAPAWNPDGDLPDNIQDLLASIPADDYATWRDVGLALNHADPVDGLAWWDWWSARSTKYDSRAVQQQWRAMTRRGHAVANPITLATVRRLAEVHGYTDPALEHGAEVASALLESHQAHLAATLLVAPRTAELSTPDLIPRTGLIADLVHWILATSIRPQPELAVAAATAFLGALAGRRYATETDLRTNFYLVGIADSGAGKDHARKCLSKLAAAAGLNAFLGGERVASGPGLVSALRRHPSQLFMIDEFGLMLGAMTCKGADSHKRDLMATLMSLYSSASTTYRGTEYADQEKRPRAELVQPNACVYGTSTPDQFFAALTSMQGLDGSLARMIVVNAGPRPARQRPAPMVPPQTLVEACRALAAFHKPGAGNLAGMGGTEVDTVDPLTVTMRSEVYSAWDAFDEEMVEHSKTGGSQAVYARVAENAAKLALIHAVARDLLGPRIDVESFAWGRELAVWAANSLVQQVERLVSDNETEATSKRLARVIRDAGPAGLGRSELLRRCRWLRTREMTELLGGLVEAGLVVAVPTPSDGGRPSMVYRCP